MNSKQDAHLNSIVEAFNEAVIAKYTAGAAEHGGDLFDMGPDALLTEAINEAIDQFVYLTTLRQKMRGEIRVDTTR